MMIHTDQQTLRVYKNRIVSFIREYTKNAGLSTGAIGLSGGIDSALSYFLVCEALGARNVIAVIMPYRTTEEHFIENARALIQLTNGEERYYNITSMVDSFRTLSDTISDIRLGNIMARVRMILLYDIAAENSGLVIGTGNKTEILLGYFTVYGDGGCGIEPLGDLYKTEVWEMAKLFGIPDEIVNQSPSAGFWRGQTDESDLSITYKTADSILHLLIEKNFTPEEIESHGFRRMDIERVLSLVRRSRFKRHMPPIVPLKNQMRDELL